MYQNLGIAVSASLSMFKDRRDVAKAVGVPIFYGVYASILIGIVLLSAWKLGWTYAPTTDPLCTVLSGNYQPVPGTVRGEAAAAHADGGDAEAGGGADGATAGVKGQGASPASLQLLERT